MEETEIQRYERLCKEAGITTIIMNFMVKPEQLYKFFRVVVKDCESTTPKRIVEDVLSTKKYHIFFLEEDVVEDVVEEDVFEKSVNKPIFVDSNMVVDETPVWKEESKKNFTVIIKSSGRNIKEDVYNIISENDGLLITRKVGELSEIALRTVQKYTKILRDEKRIRKEGDFWTIS